MSMEEIKCDWNLYKSKPLEGINIQNKIALVLYSPNQENYK